MDFISLILPLINADRGLMLGRVICWERFWSEFRGGKKELTRERSSQVFSILKCYSLKKILLGLLEKLLGPIIIG